MNRRHLVRLASLALIVTALAPADASSGHGVVLKTKPRHAAVASAPSLTSHLKTATERPLTTAVERASTKPLVPVQRHDPVADAQRFVELINRTRKAHGLAPLSTRKDLRLIATRWSAAMAAKQKIWHNSNFRYEIAGWWRLGENVGWAAGTVEYLHQEFLASPEHRRNILDPRFTSIGVAETVSADGRIFVVEDFGRFSPL